MGQKAVDIALKQIEQQKNRELTSRFSSRMSGSDKDLGKIGSLRHTVLTAVASENYERAIQELEGYCATRGDFPQFKPRAERFLQYAVDLVNAVKAKRSFPGLQNLAMAKQQELFDRAMKHFEDLKIVLKKVEKIEVDLKLEDVRSTMLVVKAVIYCVFALFALGFLMEVSRGVLPTASDLMDSYFGDFVDWLFDTLGL